MTVREWIEAMGGIKVVAAMFGLKYKAVHNWAMYNRIPPEWHLRVFRAAASRGLAFDPEQPCQVLENKRGPEGNGSRI